MVPSQRKAVHDGSSLHLTAVDAENVAQNRLSGHQVLAGCEACLFLQYQQAIAVHLFWDDRSEANWKHLWVTHSDSYGGIGGSSFT